MHHLSSRVLNNHLFICPDPLAGSGSTETPTCSQSQELSERQMQKKICVKAGLEKRTEEREHCCLSWLHSSFFQWVRCLQGPSLTDSDSLTPHMEGTVSRFTSKPRTREYVVYNLAV